MLDGEAATTILAQDESKMNKVYRVVWNAVLGVWQVASELVKSHGKTKSRKAIGLAIGIAGGSLLASAATAAGLPTGGNIVAGDGSIQQGGNNMAIHQGSDKLAIDWQSFSIGHGNTVQFFQPGKNAIALNRVLGSDVSVIQGALKANGQVFLVNPNGVLFTPSAQVDVGALVASTLNMTTEDFLSGNYRFSGDSTASIINQGNINAAERGTIALIAAKIVNDGNITAHKGNVLLGAGSVVTLDLGGPVQLEVEEGALNALIENGGAIRADAGNIYLTARAAETLAGTVINSTGLIEARSLDIGEDGMVTLLGGQGDVQVAGRIDVSSESGKGGKVVVTGDRVAIEGGAELDATGATGGGEIYVGGGWQGRDPAIKQASQTTIAKGAVLDASATDNGNGGTVVAWSDVSDANSLTRVDGTLKSAGGTNGGNGGKIETSGAKLAVSQAADASAANGKGGVWLLDPDAVTVAAGSGGLTGGANGEEATVGFDAINTALAGGTDVAIKADSSITWNGDYKPAVINGERSLTLEAGKYITNDDGKPVYSTGDINLNGNIDARDADGSLSMVFDGNLKLGKDIELHSNGGDILFGAWVDSAADAQADARSLTVNTVASGGALGNGKVTFSDMVGGTNPLDSLYVTTSANGKTYINGSVVRTWKEQVYNSQVELGTVQFVNPDFEQGTVGWTITDGRFITGSTIVDGWTSPLDDQYPAQNNSNGNNGDSRDSVRDDSYSHEVVAGAEGEGDALKLTLSANCGGGGGGGGYCVVRGPYVVSDSAIALAKGESVQFDWTAQAGPGQDAYDVFGYLLNVDTGEAQIILNRTGESDTGGSPWGTATVTADKAGTYKFVFVSGSYDFTGGSVLGASLTIDNIAASSGPKSLNGSAITFGQGLNITDNDFTIKADEIDLGGSVTGSGKLAFETLDPSKDISVGGSRSAGGDPVDDGTLQLSKEDLDALAGGFESIRIGGKDMGGDIRIVEETRIQDDLVINSGTGNIHIEDKLTVVNDDGSAVLVLESSGGRVDQTENGAIVADGLVLLGDNAIHDLDSADNDVDTIASNTGSVSFADIDDLTVGTVTVPDSQTDDDQDGVQIAGMTQTGDLNLVANKITVDEAVSTEGDTSLTADEIDLAANISGDGSLTLKQKTDGLDIHLGGSADPETVGGGDPLVLSQADLDNILDGFDKITIGDVGTGNITVDGEGVALKDDVALNAGGKLDLQGDLTLKDPQGKDEDDEIGNGLVLTVDATGGATQADGATITADELVLRGNGEFDLGKSAHNVSVIAADVGSLEFSSVDDLTVGVVDGLAGITSDEAVSLKTGGDFSLAKGILIENGPGDDVDAGETRADDIITLEVAGNATQSDDSDAKLDASGLVLLGGNFELGNSGNVVGDIASNAGKVSYVNEGDLKVGSLTATYADGTQETITGVNNTGDVSISTDGNLAINDELTTVGNVFLTVSGKTTQDAEGNIAADGLALNGGDFELRNAGNTVGEIASDAGKVAFNNTGNLQVGTLTETDGNGDLVKITTGVNNTGDVSISTDGNLAINEELTTDSNVFLTVGGTTTQDAEGNITADGLALNGGDFELRNAGNKVGDIASDAGKVAFNNTGNLQVGTLTETDGNGDLVKTTIGVNNTGDVSISTNRNLTISEKLETTGKVFLHVTGTATQDAGKGGITAAGLALTGGDFDLNDASNWVGTVASRADDVSFSSNGDLTVGTLTETALDGTQLDQIVGINNSGKVKVVTSVGDIELTENVATTSRASDAIVLNAGQSASAGVAAGGDVKADDGVTVTTGAGGRAVIYTGSLAGSSNLDDVVGSGSGNFRYNSDEEQSNFTKALGNSGVHAVYREQPTLVVSTNGTTTKTKVFDGKTSFNGGGIAGYDADGLWNGDTKQMLGTPLYSVGSSGPGSHPINISGLTELGYLIQSNPNNAELTVTPSVDYDAARQNIADATRIGSEVTTPHLPDRTIGLSVQQDLSNLGVVDGGLLLVDQAGMPANGNVGASSDGAVAQGNAAEQSVDGDSERDLAGSVCADGGTSEGGACAAYPPQTVFVVQGGVRLPSVATRR